MASLTRFLADTLKLTVNATKSAVAPTWERTFPGYSLTVHQAPRLRIAPRSRQRLVARVPQLLSAGRGRSLARIIQDLNPVRRGWAAYFQLAETKRVLEELDGWMRRKLRCLLWRKWKRP